MARTTCLLLSALLLSGCGAEAPPRGIQATDAGLEFEGVRPCADCVAIATRLRLEQAGEARRYRLSERYDLGNGERRFDETGAWESDGDLLRLRRQDGGERVYVRLDDGRLHARDEAGRPLPAAADDVLVPVSFDSRR